MVKHGWEVQVSCACVRVSTSKKDSVRECVSKRECKCERVNQREREMVGGIAGHLEQLTNTAEKKSN